MSLPTTILAPTGMLGYGFPEADFWDAIDRGVDVIIVDSGSTDPGPYMLGLGTTIVTEESYIRDLRPLLCAVHKHRIPLFIGSAGGAGTNAQVDQMAALINRLATEEGFGLKIATVYADVPASVVRDQMTQGKMEPDVRGHLPTPDDVSDAAGLVAQMGSEPFTAIINGSDHIDVIVAGRAYDPAPHAAWCIARGVEPGIAWHMGKILECGGACCEPKGGGVVATVYSDAFELTPMSPGQLATPLSIAAHTLYEKSRPDLHAGPAGVLDVSDCRFTAVDKRTVRVTRSKFVPSERPSLKVEGASIVGHRAVFVGGVRDPILIGQIDSFLAEVEGRVGKLHPDLAAGVARLDFHIYGRNGVMGEVEPSSQVPHEIGILGQVTAPTQEMARAICSTARIGVLHLSYPGQISTAGNLALPLNPIDIPIGPVCAFNVYNVMDAEGLDLFAITALKVGTP